MEKQVVSKTILQYVSFSLGKEIFALDVMKIRGVERLTEITGIPNYPDFVEGVINLRSEIIPIVDMRRRFQMDHKEPDKETRIVLVELGLLVVGLIVDKVYEVFQLRENEIGQVPKVTNVKVGRHFIRGVADVRNRLIILLDMDKLFSEEEAETLSQTV